MGSISRCANSGSHRNLNICVSRTGESLPLLYLTMPWEEAAQNTASQRFFTEPSVLGLEGIFELVNLTSPLKPESSLQYSHLLLRPPTPQWHTLTTKTSSPWSQLHQRATVNIELFEHLNTACIYPLVLSFLGQLPQFPIIILYIAWFQVPTQTWSFSFPLSFSLSFIP